ncbi:MAG: non-homologous end-joining DNA ligase, partial [Ginsengibacter sp.]
MLAKETEKPFDSKDWLFEIKWDGYRAISEKNKNNISLYSRNGISFEYTYPVVTDQLKLVNEDVVLDGEVVVLDDEGRPSFQFLQHYSENSHRPIQYHIFDLLQLNGHDTTGLPLLDRKELLQLIIPENEVIKYSDHILEHGKAFFQVSTEKNLEGIMAKKIDSKYYVGSRTTEWLKIKNHKTQEAIIAGYTDPGGTRKYFGALILGSMVGNKLTYIGHTGTGFDQKLLKEMYELLQPLAQEDSPFDEKIKTNMPVTWIKPTLICEVKYAEITADGKLRHPVFLHLREDKNINEVIMAKSTPVKQSVQKKSTPAKGEKEKAISKKKSDTKEQSEIFIFGRDKIKATHL